MNELTEEINNHGLDRLRIDKPGTKYELKNKVSHGPSSSESLEMIVLELNRLNKTLEGIRMEIANK